MKKEDSLIIRLIQSMLDVSVSDPNMKNIYNYISRIINERSMLHIPTPKEVDKSINALAEKMEINTQFEKAKLFMDYVNRLKMIFEKKSFAQREMIHNMIHIVIRMAHSPLVNTRNIDMMRELFENRYIRNEYNKIIKTKNICEDIEIIHTVQFEKVDYNEETESWSSENDKREEEKIQSNESENNQQHKEQEQLKKTYVSDDITLAIQLIPKKPKDTPHSLLRDYQELFIKKSYFMQMPQAFFEHSMMINQRDIIDNGKRTVDSDFILNRVLHLFSLINNDELSNNNRFFINSFNKLIIADMSQELFVNIILKLNEQRNNMNFLRQINQCLVKYDISSVVISKLNSILNEFINIHNTIIDRFMKVHYYQKGKIDNDQETYFNLFFINNSIHSSSFSVNPTFLFIKTLIEKSNEFISLLLQSKGKISLIKFINFYNQHLQPIISYFVTIYQEIIATKQLLTTLNKYSTSLLIKDILDKMYSLSRNNQLLNIEVFICLIQEYIKFIYEFIINGNLIDVHNEFFIDHLLARNENKKFIFCFNEKYHIFNWIDCFKIKNSTINNIEGACVPLVFMNNNLHFKLLETAKTTFLLKNLKVVSYLDDFNKDCLFEDKIDYAIYLTKERKEIDNKYNHSIKLKKSEAIEEFNELKALNEKLKISKEHIETFMQDAPSFATNAFFPHNNHSSKSNIITFTSGEANIKLDQDIEMEDITMTPFILNNSKNINSNQLSNTQYEINNHISNHVCYEDDKEIKDICDIIQHNKDKSNSSLAYSSYNINTIISNLFFNHILLINKIINTKFIDILHNNLNIQEHFDFMLHLFLFKAGFSMNTFIFELNTFIYNQAKQTNKISIDHSFYLKNLLVELSSDYSSDLKQYKDKIISHLNVSFKEEISLHRHSNQDLIFMNYQPDLPISIFFDKSIIGHYNSVFNYIVKIKRTLILIRDISLDKAIKSYHTTNENKETIIKNFINYRMHLLHFSVNLEFYIFNFVLNTFIEKFKQKSASLNSIDQYINSHSRFIKNIYAFLGLNDAALMTKMYKILNLIVGFQPLFDKLCFIDDNDDEDIEELYMTLVNTMEKFKRKEEKINKSINFLKEKLIIQ